MLQNCPEKSVCACCCLTAGEKINIDVYVVCFVVYMTFSSHRGFVSLSLDVPGRVTLWAQQSWGGERRVSEDTIINMLYGAGRREGWKPIGSHRAPVGVSAVYFTASESPESERDRQPI